VRYRGSAASATVYENVMLSHSLRYANRFVFGHSSGSGLDKLEIGFEG
jgi:hypothetical protein